MRFSFAFATIFFLAHTLPVETISAQANGETTYNLTYELYGGTNDGANPTSYTAASNVTLKPATKANLAFYGWYSNQSYLEEFLVKTLPGRHLGVTKLFAKYGPLNYQLTLDFNNGSPAVVMPSETLYTDPATATWSEPNTDSNFYFSLTRDLNNDGNDDFIGYSSASKQRQIYMNNGDDTFTKTTTNSFANTFVWSADFVDMDDDGKSDLITFYQDTTVGISKGNGDGTFQAEVFVTLASGGQVYSQLTVGRVYDLNNDNLPDLVIGASGIFVYRLNLGNNTFGQAQVIAQDNYGFTRDLRVNDLNQDGYLDFFGVGNNGSVARFGSSSGLFTGGTSTTLTSGGASVRFFLTDADRDGQLDIFGGSGGGLNSGRYQTYNADGTHKALTYLDLLQTGSWGGGARDVNGDGYNDYVFFPGRKIVYSKRDGGYTIKDASFTGSQSAEWIQNADGSYGVFLIDEAADLAKYHKFVPSQSVAYLNTTPTRSGYTFGGWFDNPEFSGSVFNFNTGITENKNLYAKWTPNTYTIAYTLNGGINNDSNTNSYNVETPTITLASPTRDSYRFEGWYDNSSFTGEKVTEIALGSNGNKQLFAKWVLVYSVYFETNGGSTLDISYYASGETITLPTNPTKEGHTFEGWYTDAALTSSFTGTTMPGNNISLYAKWTVNSYTVTYVVDEVIQSTDNIEFDSTLASIEDPIKEGYAFEGWLLDGELVDLTTFTMPAENIELVASFRANSAPFNVLAAVGIGGGIAGIGGIAWWLLFILLPKRRKDKTSVISITEDPEEDESMENVSFFSKPITIVQAFYDTLAPTEQTEFRSLFVEDTPQHLVKELTYRLGELNEPFFVEVYKFLFRYRKIISLDLLKKLTTYGLSLAEGQPQTMSLILESATKTSYSRRKDQAFLEYASQLTRKDIALQRNVLNPREKFVYSFYRLSIILEKQKQIKEALVIVNEALSRGLIDNTKGGYEGRKERLLIKQR